MSKKAELHIKGIKEPIIIDEFEAIAIEELRNDATKDPRSVIAIEGVWSGAKSEVRYIKWIREEERHDYKRKIDPMPAHMVKAFEEKILPYQVQSETHGFGTHKWPLFYMQAAGALRLEIYENKQGFISVNEIVTDYLLYPKVQDEVESYMLHLDRVAYAKKMREKELEKMALETEVTV